MKFDEIKRQFHTFMVAIMALACSAATLSGAVAAVTLNAGPTVPDILPNA